MPRQMPRFDLELAAQAQSAIAIARAGEIAHASGGRSVRKEWTTTRLEALYELAYLRVFAAWEMYMEAVFLRSLCGYESTAGQEQLHAGTYHSTLAAAEAAVLGGRHYLLWQNPQQVIDRCQQFFKSGAGYPCLQETIVTSSFTDLTHLASTRHRIVHTHQNDAKSKFDAATMHIAGRTYSLSRPGKFLRDSNTSIAPHRSWLEITTQNLTAMIRQIV
jgi:hypothetical protein